MKNKHLALVKFFLAAVLLTSFLGCNHYDPYKNPRPSPKPKEHREPRFNWPPLPSCNRQQENSPGVGSPEPIGGGCTRRVDTIQRKPHHQKKSAPKEDKNGPIYPCPNHIFPFCTDENPFGVTYKSGTYGYAAFPKNADIGCLKIAPCPTWYYMQIDHPGDLLIYIEQRGTFRKLDVDFACWGPFEARSKREFLDLLCSSYYELNVDVHDNHRPANGDHRGDMGGYPFGNLVDCSFDQAGTEWCYIPNAKTGEWYLLLLTNYSRKKGTIHFERVDEMSTATTNCNVVIPITLNPIPSGMRQIDDHTTAICLYDEKALVTIELETDEGYKLPRNALRHSEVTITANGKTYRATLEKDHFECEIDIFNDTTEYAASIVCTDPAFDLDTEPYYFIRTTDCDPDRVQFEKGEPYYAGDLTTIELVEGNKPVKVDFSDSEGVTGGLPGAPRSINPEDYDITVEYDGLLIEGVPIKKDEETIELIPQMKGDWCDCFMPDTMTFTIRMIPNNGDINATPYEIPIQIGVLQQTVWIGRCLWVLITMGLLLLFILYLIALMRKKRFKKDAMVKPTYYDYYGNRVEQNGTLLRKEGVLAWFARWFLPGDESRVLGFDSPMANLRFVAAASDDVVNIPKENIDTSRMSINGYDPENDTYPKKPVVLGNNGKVVVRTPEGNDAGYLTFTSGDRRDGHGYRIALFILVISAADAFLAFAWLLLQGLFY